MDSILEEQWYTGNGQTTKVDLIEKIESIVSIPPVEERIIMIGTDGQKRKKRPGIDFVTVVAIHNKGKGGTGFWARSRFSRGVNLREKLEKETWQSLEVAFAIMDKVPEDGKHEIEIHIDANTDDRHASSRYYKQLSGMVAGQGFKHVLKPHSWVASHAADHFVKNKHLKRDCL